MEFRLKFIPTGKKASGPKNPTTEFIKHCRKMVDRARRLGYADLLDRYYKDKVFQDGQNLAHGWDSDHAFFLDSVGKMDRKSEEEIAAMNLGWRIRNKQWGGSAVVVHNEDWRGADHRPSPSTFQALIQRTMAQAEVPWITKRCYRGHNMRIFKDGEAYGSGACTFCNSHIASGSTQGQCWTCYQWYCRQCMYKKKSEDQIPRARR